MDDGDQSPVKKWLDDVDPRHGPEQSPGSATPYSEHGNGAFFARGDERLLVDDFRKAGLSASEVPTQHYASILKRLDGMERDLNAIDATHAIGPEEGFQLEPFKLEARPLCPCSRCCWHPPSFQTRATSGHSRQALGPPGC